MSYLLSIQGASKNQHLSYSQQLSLFYSLASLDKEGLEKLTEEFGDEMGDTLQAMIMQDIYQSIEDSIAFKRKQTLNNRSIALSIKGKLFEYPVVHDLDVKHLVKIHYKDTYMEGYLHQRDIINGSVRGARVVLAVVKEKVEDYLRYGQYIPVLINSEGAISFHEDMMSKEERDYWAEVHPLIAMRELTVNYLLHPDPEFVERLCCLTIGGDRLFSSLDILRNPEVAPDIVTATIAVLSCNGFPGLLSKHLDTDPIRKVASWLQEIYRKDYASYVRNTGLLL